MSTCTETWCPIIGFEGRFEVSNTGKFRSVIRGAERSKILKPMIRKDGLKGVYLKDANGRGRWLYIGETVARAFVPNNGNLPNVVHVNGDLSDDRCENLKWTDEKAEHRTIHNWNGASVTDGRLYNIWKSMVLRCTDPSRQRYSRYGGRGITVCDEWLDDFESFRTWAHANGYAANLTIDRIDNDGSYCPENCRWITNKEQSANRSNNHLIEIDGVIDVASNWAKKASVSKFTVYYWIKHHGVDYAAKRLAQKLGIVA